MWSIWDQDQVDTYRMQAMYLQELDMYPGWSWSQLIQEIDLLHLLFLVSENFKVRLGFQGSLLAS